MIYCCLPAVIRITDGQGQERDGHVRNTNATLEDHHPVGAHSLEDKNEFAEAITQVYEAVPIPRFYVVVIFEEVAADSFFVGGAAHGTFVRIQIEDNVKALVYLSAYALEEGESLGALQGRFPDPPLAAALVYTTFPIDGPDDTGTDASVYVAKFPGILARDVKRFGYQRAGTNAIEIDSSHLVMLSHLHEVADLIRIVITATAN